mmetsp:Transcript_1748/g.4656  ORF Transcript_1748/g.4656 Transcript_1748/m.4656 type:complete len:478 (-) Transcript_1748:86-1519(-)
MRQMSFLRKKTAHQQIRFHLHDDVGKVSWVDSDDVDLESRFIDTKDLEALKQSPKEDDEGKLVYVNWSATVILRGKNTSESLRNVELSLSSTLASSFTSSPRLVRQHSRLSVPVLKSALQKNVRRRRPLPAVRVAMELADRSWSDLIRRLPIIILEDGVLHPEFPMIVWLMVAESKGFIPSVVLLKKVMHVVFETAACPWSDPLPPIVGASNDDSMLEISDCLCDNTSVDERHIIGVIDSRPFSVGDTKGIEVDACAVQIESIRVRQAYGGMKCDMAMLKSYRRLWQARFSYLSHTTVTRLSGRNEICFESDKLVKKADHLQWRDIPSLCYSSSKEQSRRLIPGIFGCGGQLDQISISDVPPAAIDFHCSNILDALLSNPELYRTISKRVETMQISSIEVARQGASSRRDCLASIIKDLMWSFSSGINHKRRLLRSQTLPKNGKEKALRTLWEDAVLGPARSYAEKYIADRVRPCSS